MSSSYLIINCHELIHCCRI